jgi:hypothetical protein
LKEGFRTGWILFALRTYDTFLNFKIIFRENLPTV